MKKNKFLIFKPTKSAMQSGYNNSRKWCLSNNDINESFISSKFCWNGSSNPEKQIKLFFDDLESAINFAKKNKYDYEVQMPNKRSLIKKSYAENFFEERLKMGKERFCPDWLFKIIISQTVYDYIVRDVALFISARKFISFFKILR